MSNRRRPIDKARDKRLAHDGGIENVAAGLGTSRDKSYYTRYTTPVPFEEQTLIDMYRQSWLAGQIVDVVTDDMTSKWRTASSKAFKEDATLFQRMEEKFDLRARITETLRWSRLFGGACMVIAIEGDEFDKPLVLDSIRQGSLRQFFVLDRYSITPSEKLEQDPLSVHFGKPESYRINQTAQLVHSSRIIKLGGSRMPYRARQNLQYWDDSVLQRAYDSIINSDTAMASVASMFFEANVDVISAEGMADLLSTKQGQQKVIARYQAAATIKSFNRLLLLDGGEKYDKKQNNFANVHDVIEKFMVYVAGAADIPVTRLFGKSASGLNATGEGDMRNYYDSLQSRQSTDLRPALRYADEIMLRSELGTMPDDYSFEFCALWQQTDKEKADTQKVKADRDKIYLDSGVITQAIVARQLVQDGTYKISDEEIADLEAMAEVGGAEDDSKDAGEEVPPTEDETDAGEEP